MHDDNSTCANKCCDTGEERLSLTEIWEYGKFCVKIIDNDPNPTLSCLSTPSEVSIKG